MRASLSENAPRERLVKLNKFGEQAAARRNPETLDGSSGRPPKVRGGKASIRSLKLEAAKPGGTRYKTSSFDSTLSARVPLHVSCELNQLRTSPATVETPLSMGEQPSTPRASTSSDPMTLGLDQLRGRQAE